MPRINFAASWFTDSSACAVSFETLLHCTVLRAHALRRREPHVILEPQLTAIVRGELWLALQQQQQQTVPDRAVVVVRNVSNQVRRDHQTKHATQGQHVHQQATTDPTDTLNNRLDALRYLDVIRQQCSPSEWQLLQERLVWEHSFERLAEQRLGTTDAPSIAREATRLRKQVHRLRRRCQTALTHQYPNARQDLQ